MVEARGDQVFECADPFGYVWEFSQPIAELALDDALTATRAQWFGDDRLTGTT